MAGLISSVNFMTAVIFTPETRTAFAERLESFVSVRRYHVSPEEKVDMINWLTEFGRKCESKQEYNRRHWVRTNFCYDADKDRLLYKGGDRLRKVITTNKVPSVVEREHRASHIRGQNDTWQKVTKKYYGLTQKDVTFLLGRCEVCRSRPRGGAYIEGRARRLRRFQDAPTDG
jgi:hypothetical protein